MNTLIQGALIKSVREMAQAYSFEQLTRCLEEQIEHQSNSCVICGEASQMMDTLARASVVRQLMDNGASLPESVRELGRRMRSVYIE